MNMYEFQKSDMTTNQNLSDVVGFASAIARSQPYHMGGTENTTAKCPMDDSQHTSALSDL